uniref:PDZ domain-containing protein n=1 Tax=Panagrellus redivivus TaxID=6233 RepID=A0A7E5A1X4_PANRE
MASRHSESNVLMPTVKNDNNKNSEAVTEALRTLRQRNVDLAENIFELEKTLRKMSETSRVTNGQTDENKSCDNNNNNKKTETKKEIPPELLMRMESCRSEVVPRIEPFLPSNSKLFFVATNVIKLRPRLTLQASHLLSPNDVLDANGNHVVQPSEGSGAGYSNATTAAAASFLVIGPHNLRKRSGGCLRVADRIVSIDSTLVGELDLPSDARANVSGPSLQNGLLASNNHDQQDDFGLLAAAVDKEAESAISVLGIVRESTNPRRKSCVKMAVSLELNLMGY